MLAGQRACRTAAASYPGSERLAEGIEVLRVCVQVILRGSIEATDEFLYASKWCCAIQVHSKWYYFWGVLAQSRTSRVGSLQQATGRLQVKHQHGNTFDIRPFAAPVMDVLNAESFVLGAADTSFSGGR